jgi:6-pyruvoyltetrahydropterin/6-carboxytetrahydropterin synthase
MVYDFIALKRDMEGLLAELDHRVLLPASNPSLDLVTSAGEVEVRHNDQRYVFPESDVVVLPIPNTTAEKIAEYLGDRLANDLRLARARSLERIEVEVEETPGQSAFWSGRLGT